MRKTIYTKILGGNRGMNLDIEKLREFYKQFCYNACLYVRSPSDGVILVPKLEDNLMWEPGPDEFIIVMKDVDELQYVMAARTMILKGYTNCIYHYKLNPAFQFEES